MLPSPRCARFQVLTTSKALAIGLLGAALYQAYNAIVALGGKESERAASDLRPPHAIVRPRKTHTSTHYGKLRSRTEMGTR